MDRVARRRRRVLSRPPRGAPGRLPRTSMGIRLRRHGDGSGVGTWRRVGSYPPELGHICNASVLYGAHLRFLRYDLNAWRRGEPNDWNLWKRMWGAGVRMGFVDRVVGKHFLEHSPRETTSPRGVVRRAAP